MASMTMITSQSPPQLSGSMRHSYVRSRGAAPDDVAGPKINALLMSMSTTTVPVRSSVCAT